MKTLSPGFKPNEHWSICDRCGFAYREYKLLKEWTGLVVCESCFEERHPQDLVKGVKDDTSPVGLHRPEVTDQFISVTYCYTRNAIPGQAIPGCAIPGNTSSQVEESSVPTGTFGA